MAPSVAPVSHEPWHSRGVRRIVSRNFFIYYVLDDANGSVYILNVIYARRDQLKVLKDNF